MVSLVSLSVKLIPVCNICVIPRLTPLIIFVSVTPKAQNTFFDTAKDSLSKPLFTADLQYHAAGKYGFGELDSSAYSGSIHYTDVDNSQGFWGFTGTGYAVGSGSVQKLSIPTIADTGTTLLLVPDAVVKAYYKQVDGAKKYVSLPVIEIPYANSNF